MQIAKLSLKVLLAALTTAAVAQVPMQPPSTPQAERINVQATTSNGVPMRELTVGDFSLLDNHRDSRILSVKAETPATDAVHAIILLDAVNVRYTELSYERQQLLTFLKANGGKLAVPTGVAVLTNKGVQLQKNFSQDGNALAAALDDHVIGFRTITRAAGFYGATERFETSATGLRTLASFAATLPGRKFVLWVSPGWPLLSGPEVQLDRKGEKQVFGNIVGISNGLREANITLYALNALGADEDVARANYYRAFTKGVSKPGDAQLGDLGLEVIAEQSGGLALQGSTDLTRMIERCFNDTAFWYEIRFAPTEAAGDTPFHPIELKVDKPGVALRTRQSYYAAR